MIATRERQLQLDILKALAIIFVVAIHSTPVDWLVRTWGAFHIWQAVPLFIATMGVSAYPSFKRLSSRAPAAAGAQYVKRRATRLLIPFAVLWVVMLAAGFLRGTLYFGPLTLLLQLPLTGPGNYFVPVALQLALATPLLFRSLNLAPKTTLLVAAAANVGFELLATAVPVFSAAPYLYNVCALRYLLLFAVGMWFGMRIEGGSLRLTAPLVVYAAASTCYYVYVGLTGHNLFVLDLWRWQNVLGFGYTSLLVALALMYLPATGNGPLAKAAEAISRASYHVFLFQMAFFAILPLRTVSLKYLPANLTICLVAGYLLFLLQRALEERLERRAT